MNEPNNQEETTVIEQPVIETEVLNEPVFVAEKKKKRRKREEPRKDVWFIDASKLVIKPGYNIRINYGDLSELEEMIEKSPDKMPPLKAHKVSGAYNVTDGFRRTQAALNVTARTGKEVKLPIYPEPKGYKEIDRLTDMFLLNQGKELEMLEQAEGVRRFRDDYNLSEKEIAKQIHKSITHVRNCLLLLKAPEDVKKYISDNVLAPSMVYGLFKKYPLGEAIRILRETIEAVSAQSVQLELNVEDNSGIDIVSTGENGSDGNTEFANINPTDDSPSAPLLDEANQELLEKSKDNKDGWSINDEIKEHEVVHDSDNGDIITPLKVRRVTMADVNNTIERYDSLGAFKKLVKKYGSFAFKKNELHAEELLFFQRILDGAVSAMELWRRYFDVSEEDLAEVLKMK